MSQLSVSNNDYPIGGGEARVRATHESNMHALADQCWPSLEQCHSYCVEDLYALGLPCHIRTVKFIRDMTRCDLQLFPRNYGVRDSLYQSCPRM